MQTGKPSHTALAAAFHRAAHQVLEHGRSFADPLAIRILGLDAQSVARRAEERPSARRMRLFIVVRARFAEDDSLRSKTLGRQRSLPAVFQAEAVPFPTRAGT